MSAPERLTGIVWRRRLIEAFRDRDDPHEETWEVSGDEAADLLLSCGSSRCPKNRRTAA